MLALLSAAACAGGGDPPPVTGTPTPAGASPTTAVTQDPVVEPSPTTADAAPPPAPPPPQVDVEIRFVRAVDDAATADFGPFVAAVLNDPRGWARAGFRFHFSDDAPFTVVLAEGSQVDRLCEPYNTGGRYSCQIGPVVALNADRWRSATDTWPGSLDEYRTMLVNHEVGHLLGQHHPERPCTRPGRRSAVMAQQSGGLRGCAANPWPLRWEIRCAARHEEPLAPGYEADAQPMCGPQDVRG